MTKKNSTRRSNPIGIVSGITAATIAAGCGQPQPKQVTQWKKAPGTNGFINLDAVKEAFLKHGKAGDFEKRVNEIFEGDNLVIFRSSPTGTNGFVYTAYEDLDKDKNITSKDDLLFTLTVANRRATLKGAGVNSYYSQSWAYTPEEKKSDDYYRTHHTHRHGYGYWYWGRRWPRYYTPAPQYDTYRQHRSDYRQSPGFAQQVRSNADFEKRAAAQYGAGFRKTASSVNSTRSNYIRSTSSRAGFAAGLVASQATSGWGVRANNRISSSYSSAKSAGSRSSSSTSRSSSRSSSRGGSFGGSRGSSGIGV